MKTIIHVNQHIIRSNSKTGERKPPLTVKNYRSNRPADSAEIVDETGRVVARVLYRPDDPLGCGAKVWIETDLTVLSVETPVETTIHLSV